MPRSARLQGTEPDQQRQIRYALVGLGHIAQAAILPAFANASPSAKLTALVSGDPVKLKKLGKRYGVDNLYSYEEYERCLSSTEIDAVYLSLPNNLHKEYAVKAALSGIHVLCEKPMAITSAEAEDMIAAARENNIKLMIAYRLHFEAANLSVMELVKQGKIGEARLFNSVFTMQVKEGDIRVQRKLGGGSLYDIGIYCINAARHIFAAEPTEVVAFTASSDDDRFDEVDEITSAVLRFPGERIASFTCSFGAEHVSSLQVLGSRGQVTLTPAYTYEGVLEYRLTVDGKTKSKQFPPRDQFAPELIYFSECIQQNKEPEPSGVEGLIDIRIIEAIYQSAAIRRAVKLENLPQKESPDLSQAISRPPLQKQELVHSEPPTQ